MGTVMRYRIPFVIVIPNFKYYGRRHEEYDFVNYTKSVLLISVVIMLKQ